MTLVCVSASSNINYQNLQETRIALIIWPQIHLHITITHFSKKKKLCTRLYKLCVWLMWIKRILHGHCSYFLPKTDNQLNMVLCEANDKLNNLHLDCKLFELVLLLREWELLDKNDYKNGYLYIPNSWVLLKENFIFFFHVLTVNPFYLTMKIKSCC